MSSATAATKMTYRFLGNSGLLVSKLALGSWMFQDEKNTVDAWYQMMKTAFANGVNFREDLVVTAKIFSGTKGFHNGTPNSQGLNREHLIEGTKASLAKMGLDYVDVIFCHHPDAFTPIEETVRAMNYIIEKGWAFYWGTSNWSVSEITETCEIADRLGLIRPIVEQSQYSIFERNRVEFELVDLIKTHKYGITAWSPLAFGTLTGKYGSGCPEGSRMHTEDMRNAIWGTDFEERVQKADKLKPIAAELGCSLAQLALAWCVANENVSTVIVGASRQSQLEENLKALDFVEKLTPHVMTKIDAVVNFVPGHPVPDRLREIRERHL
ncbi:voltage-gated potassium channel subunit beta, putative [Phytophthora infestans T30-4]|uniref:Voltage-gated potassium channel subunit beta, putative n=1 Tax=Phytophthora infestans (strain T30-4) TaxID=403677 RepID=D0NI86_PHYIT|nr:voltage-gated potassium channel subunit beta, putative [Phytophthora infestans T30-4]EEY59171.1 voltage-gated potassium channel subunit beta, putative [Phytophthora infestans T30-4]|eukprot:XP_002901185.1 voltage-gated potassium channel subunit beta, putative [Phytophthora infestans T30-4]